MKVWSPILGVAAVLSASSLQGQQAAQGSWCSTRNTNVPVDSLRALVEKYHPDALKAEVSRDSVLVGFVLDASCRVLVHGTGRYHADRLGVDNLLFGILPTVQVEPFIMAGIAQATAESVPGTPWIVWVSKRT